MHRDMSKAVEKYKKRFWSTSNRNNIGCFSASDIYGIVDMHEARDSPKAFDVANSALMAGFWIGYQCARRQARQKTDHA